MTFDDVKRLARDLPEVEEETSYGTRALKVKKKLIVRLKEDGETLVLRCDIVSRDMMLRAEPKLFFITDHYKNYPAILVRLNRASERRMRELLEDAYRFVAPKTLVARLNATS
jgi:hypothetical protein